MIKYHVVPAYTWDAEKQEMVRDGWLVHNGYGIQHEEQICVCEECGEVLPLDISAGSHINAKEGGECWGRMKHLKIEVPA